MSVKNSEHAKMIHDLCMGLTKDYTQNMITREKSYITKLANLSESNSSFNFSPAEEDQIINMLDEWQFKPKSELGIYTESVIDHDDICELCGQHSKKIYFITNSRNGNVMQIGSQCIKKFNFDTVIGDNFVTVDEGLKFADEIKEDSKDVLDNNYCKILNDCHINNLSILNNTNNKDNTNKKFYMQYIQQYALAIYSLIYEINHNNEPDTELMLEVANYQTKLIDWSKKNNWSGNITFIPGYQYIIDNELPYTGKFKLCLNNLHATFYKNRAEGKKSFNMFNAMKNVYEKTKTIRAKNPGNFKYEIFPFFEDYMSHDKPIKYNILALMLTLPNDEEECGEIMKNFFRFKRKNKLALEIDEKFIETVKKFYENVITKNFDDEFSKFIIMLYNNCNTSLKELMDDIDNTINKPRRNTNRHRNGNNFI